VSAFEVIQPGGGTPLEVGALRTRIVASAASTGGAYSAMHQIVPPRRLVAPHVHANEDQLAIVLSGELGFRVGADEFSVPAGGTALRLRGVPHALWNATDEEATLYEVTSPGTFEKYFRALHALWRQDGPPAPAAVSELMGPYGLEPFGEWTEELCARLGLQLA
jgi:quercetin dioxygenase-like cupin family protein